MNVLHPLSLISKIEGVVFLCYSITPISSGTIISASVAAIISSTV